MKRLNLIFKSLPVVFTALLASIFVSCQDDSLLPYGDAEGPEEGLPATVSLKVRIPAMDVQTRALTDEDANYCGTIWLGFFRKSDGKCTFSKMYDPPKEESSDTDTEYSLGNVQETDIDYAPMTEAEFKNISAGDLSGQTYVVAVANAEHYMGIDRSATGLVRKTKLSTLLEGVTSWEQFKKITVMRNSTTDVSLTSNTLLMSGYFDPSTTHTASNHTGYALGDDIPTVDIYSRPASYELSGAVYLRRVISYNQFNIYAGENINLTVKTWKVNNIPYCCNLIEEDGNACTEISNGVNNGLESHLFSTITDDDGTATGRSFEFYQLENKHTAVAYSASGDDYVGIKPSSDPDELYASREREFKLASGANSGVYKSLVSSYSEGNKSTTYPNNAATYVVLTADLDYWYTTGEDPTTAVPVDYENATEEQRALMTHRKAEVTYTIHLGYCEDKDRSGNPTQQTAMDFNCRRNTKYTYNVHINGVNKIVVEAKKEGENQPGAEGTVIDMSTDSYDLDAHYCVFNIELTNKQRAALQWYLTVPYGGYTYVYDSSANGVKQFNTESSGYTWIKFRPTSSMDVLAKYLDMTSTPQLTKETLRSLDDLKALNDDGDKLKYAWTDGTTTDDDPESEEPHPYTVFIDEYVYHADPTDPSISDEGQNEWLWGKYVNQENRKVDLYDANMYPSTDQESYYIPAIYTFSQRSIQTHYLEIAQNGESGFGLEHINEDYGLNFWGSMLGSYERNGRRNNINQFGNGKWAWSSFVKMTEPAVIPAGTNDWNNLAVEETLYPVPMLQSRATGSDVLYLNSSSTLKYASGAGCLNRNRDLDGDNYISASEIRWYVPGSEEYLQIAIGQTELPTPLFQFGDHVRNEFKLTTWSSYSDKRTQLQYHYWCSNNWYFFAEEGMSLGKGQFNMNDYAAHTVCYQVRCIRTLGLNPDVQPEDKDEFTYNSSFVKDEENGHIYITSKYFTANSIRPSTSSFLAPHDVGSVTSLPPYKFEVAQDVCRDMTSTDNLYDVNSQGFIRTHGSANDIYTNQTGETNWNRSCRTNSICSLYTQETDGSDKGTWRVPNIRELAMMRTEGLANATDDDTALNDSNDKTGYYLSCTYDYFENPNWNTGFLYRFYGKRGDDFSIGRNLISEPQNSQEKHVHVRCVRDVITDSDNNVTVGN